MLADEVKHCRCFPDQDLESQRKKKACKSICDDLVFLLPAFLLIPLLIFCLQASRWRVWELDWVGACTLSDSRQDFQSMLEASLQTESQAVLWSPLPPSILSLPCGSGNIYLLALSSSRQAADNLLTGQPYVQGMGRLWKDLTTQTAARQKNHGQSQCVTYFARVRSEESGANTAALQRHNWIIEIFNIWQVLAWASKKGGVLKAESCVQKCPSSEGKCESRAGQRGLWWCW